jgi:hypothetical protein
VICLVNDIIPADRKNFYVPVSLIWLFLYSTDAEKAFFSMNWVYSPRFTQRIE